MNVLQNETDYIESRVDLKFVLDYKHLVSIENLKFRQNLKGTEPDYLYSDQTTTTQVHGHTHDTVYSESEFTSYAGKLIFRANQTKEKVYENIRNYYSRLNLDKEPESPETVVKPCSAAYIQTADLLIWDRGSPASLVTFSKAITCQTKIGKDDSRINVTYDDQVNQTYTFSEKYRSSVVSAVAYGDTWLYALASGEIVIASGGFVKDSKEGPYVLKEISISEPMPLTYRPSASGEVRQQGAILQSKECWEATRELKPLRELDEIEHIEPRRPIVTLTRSTRDDQYLTVEGFRNEMFVYNLNHAASNQSSAIRVKWDKLGFFYNHPLWHIMAMTVYRVDDTFRCYAILRDLSNPTSKATYLINGDIDEDYNLSDSRDSLRPYEDIIPDDITYWSACKKIVSFYGFMYVLHNHGENIITSKGIWGILPERYFDYPIEAVHADGDNFYFFVKATTLYHAYVDPTDCRELRMLKVSRNHHQAQFFKMDKFIHYSHELRYYDGKEWIPSWDGPKYAPLVLTVYRPSNWIYVGAGILAIFVLLMVIFFVLSCCFKTGPHSTMMKSRRSLNLSGGGSNPSLVRTASPYQSQQNHQAINSHLPPRYHLTRETASEMPLFMDPKSHESSRIVSKEATKKKSPLKTTRSGTSSKSAKTTKTAKPLPMAKTPRSPLESKKSRSK